MIPRSIIYKLVRRADNIILAEGNAKDIIKLRKITPGTFVGVGSLSPAVGKIFGNSTPYTLIQK
jgi:hypothetical protein